LLLAAALLAAPLATQAPRLATAQPPADQDNRPAEAFADPAVARLQTTASGVQRELGDLAAQIHEAERLLLDAETTAAAAREERVAADAVVAAQQAEVDAYSAAVYTSLAQPTDLRALMSARAPSDFLDGAGLLDRVRIDQDIRLAGAVRRQEAAVQADEEARAAADVVGRHKADLDRRNADASGRAAAVSAELEGVVAGTNAAVVEQQRAQQERNETTAANWRGYLGRLTEAGITPPPAAALRDPARPPTGFEAFQPGVARRGDLLVLPREVLAAVTSAIDALGRPYVPGRGGTGPAAYSCDGLVTAVYGAAGLALPESAAAQAATTAPVAPPDVQPGDLVFLGPARYGVQGVGVVLDNQTMLTADARLAGVVVADLPGADTVVGFGRPSLPARPAAAVPSATDGGLTWRCGGVELPPRAAGESVGAWGGYPNGFIPLTALCPLWVADHVLRCDAAQSFVALDQAFLARFGRRSCITDSYRTFTEQVRLYAVKPALAAVPGRSNHGWGLAVDLCGGAQSFDSPEYFWLTANAPSFGWSNPQWARRGGSREEPWHWEFVGW
jgi:cell wall-associated NlpC family hydrolase